MSAYTEQEELEKLKVWWKTYGAALILGVLLGVGLLFGQKYWTQYQEERLARASDLYAVMLQQVRETKRDEARASADRLINEYEGTPYAGMAALMLARLSFETGDAAAARRHLQWAIEHARDAATEHTARLRLGRLLLASGEHDAALALLEVTRQSGFEAEYLELKGDVLSARGNAAEARAAYAEALQQTSPESPHRKTLQMKLDEASAGARA